jgi:hypothetical protein
MKLQGGVMCSDRASFMIGASHVVDDGDYADREEAWNAYQALALECVRVD